MIELSPALLSQIEQNFPGLDRWLVVGGVSDPGGDAPLTGPIAGRCAITDVLRLDFTQRYDLGVVIEPERTDVPAISRLRDVGCRRVLLLTDGLANQGITALEELEHHAAELRKRGVSTSTFGVGDRFNEELLQAMAQAGISPADVDLIVCATTTPDETFPATATRSQ